ANKTVESLPLTLTKAKKAIRCNVLDEYQKGLLTRT
ncbi:MAG: hypothetical protein ACJA0T_001475, partial [Colwellia sp.]